MIFKRVDAVTDEVKLLSTTQGKDETDQVGFGSCASRLRGSGFCRGLAYQCFNDGGGVAAALQEAGYKAVIKTGDDGDPYIISSANGEEFTIDFYDCKDKHCSSIAFSSFYKEDPMWTAALTNEWNAEKRFLRIGVDSKGRLREYLDVSTVGKLTQANFADLIDWYKSMDGALAKFIADKREAVKK